MLLLGRNLNNSSCATMMTFWHQWHTQCPKKLWKPWCLTTWGSDHLRANIQSEQKGLHSHTFAWASTQMLFIHTYTHTQMISLDAGMLLALSCFIPWPHIGLWEHSSAACKPTCSIGCLAPHVLLEPDLCHTKKETCQLFLKKLLKRKLQDGINLSGQKLCWKLAKGLANYLKLFYNHLVTNY